MTNKEKALALISTFASGDTNEGKGTPCRGLHSA